MFANILKFAAICFVGWNAFLSFVVISIILYIVTL